MTVVAVVTTPPRPAGRRKAPTATAVAERAAAHRLPLLAPERLRDAETLAALGACRAGVAVLADYGRILPPAVLGGFPHGVLGVHPSLLPRHRGASPIPAAIAAGDSETGVTIYRMDAGMDTGPIVAADRMPLDGREDAPGLEARLAADAAGLLERILLPWLAGSLEARPQPGEGATVTRLLRREDGRLDAAQTAAVLERLVRALRPWPGTYLNLPDTRLAVVAADVAPTDPADVPGTLVADGDGLALATVDGRLRLLIVRPAGGREMDAPAFRRGHPRIAGSRVG